MGIKKHPYMLLALKQSSLIKYVRNQFPYDIGIEIECRTENPTLQRKRIDKLPYISATPDHNETRIRVNFSKNAIQGLIGLYKALEIVQEESNPNTLSGIHYHVGLRGKVKEKMSSRKLMQYEKWLLNTLDSWGYTGTYNERKVSCAKNGIVRYCNQ